MKTLARNIVETGITLGTDSHNVLTVGAISAGCKQLKNASGLVDSWVVEAILSACYHGLTAGQTTPLDHIAKSLPNSINGKMWANWVQEFSPMYIDTKGKKAGIKKGWKVTDFDLDAMADCNPFDFKPVTEVKSYGIDQLLADLNKVAEGKKGKSFEVDDVAMKLASELVELAQVRNLEVKEAMATIAQADMVATKHDNTGKASPAGMTHTNH